MLEASATVLAAFHAHASSSFLSLAESYYRQTGIMKGRFHDDLGGTITALRLSFEGHQAGRMLRGNDILVFDKANSFLDEAYEKIRQLDAVMYCDSDVFFEVLKGIALKASELSGHSIMVKSFGFYGKINAGCSYLVFFSIQKLLSDIIKQSQKGKVEINILGKLDYTSLIINANSVVFDENTITGLKAIGNINVTDEPGNQLNASESKLIITIPYI